MLKTPNEALYLLFQTPNIMSRTPSFLTPKKEVYILTHAIRVSMVNDKALTQPSQ